MYKKKGAEAALENNQRRENPNENNDDTPMRSDRRVTFIVDQPRYSSALEEVINSLETLLKMKIDTAPRRNIENIIKIILAICIEFNVQMQNAQESMRTMAGVIEKLILQRFKIEALEAENRKLEDSKEKLKSMNVELTKYSDHMRIFTEKYTKSIEGVDEDRDILSELIDLKIQVEDKNIENEKLKAGKIKREAEYNEAWKWKKYHKRRATELETRIDEMKKEMRLEKEQMDTELSSAHGELEAAKVQSNMWRDECFKIRGIIDANEDEMNEMKVK